MINHARTLLLNRDGSKRPGSTFYLEEYVPTDFKPVTLPSGLLSLRQTLFGVSPDDAFMNFRLHQFMKVLHSNEYATYVTDLDNRVTYLPGRDVVDTRWSLTVTPMNANGYLSTIDLLGDFVAGVSECVLHYSVEVSIISAGIVRISNKTNGSTLETTYSVTGGLSNELALQGVPNVTFKLNGDPTVGATWLVIVQKQPNADLADLPAKIERSSSLWTTLFTGGEPYTTFGQLWDKHAYLDYRLSGVLLALVYKSEAARTHG